jgi:hypothetical protein
LPTSDAVREPICQVFPWARHLSDEETRAFTRELLGVLSDAAEREARRAAQCAVVSWRATARIHADPAQESDASKPLADTFGRVAVCG